MMGPMRRHRIPLQQNVALAIGPEPFGERMPNQPDARRTYRSREMQRPRIRGNEYPRSSREATDLRQRHRSRQARVARRGCHDFPSRLQFPAVPSHNYRRERVR